MTIVVTGGIGSGKSAVCDLISELYGFPVYNADAKVKELYFRYPEIVDRLEVLLGCVLKDEAGIFAASKLAERIFSDPNALETVEDIVFPYLMEDFDQFKSGYDVPVVFESATVLEKEAFHDFGDKILLIDAPMEIRQKRACLRDSSSYEKIAARMRAQKLMNAISDGTATRQEEYAGTLERIDCIIRNTGSFGDLEAKVREFIDGILK